MRRGRGEEGGARRKKEMGGGGFLVGGERTRGGGGGGGGGHVRALVHVPPFQTFVYGSTVESLIFVINCK
jgi:hypothetical protein